MRIFDELGIALGRYLWYNEYDLKISISLIEKPTKDDKRESELQSVLNAYPSSE